MITISKHQITAILKSLGTLPKGEKLELNSPSGQGLLKVYSFNLKASLEFQAGEGNLVQVFVDFEEFSQAIKSSQGDSIAWEKEGEQLIVSDQFGATRLDFVHKPFFSETEKKEPIVKMKAELDFASLCSAVAVLKAAITKEKTRYDLDNFHLSSRNKTVTIASTNGRFLMSQELNSGALSAKVFDCVKKEWRDCDFEAVLPSWIAKLLPTLPKSISRVWIEKEDDIAMMYGKGFIVSWDCEARWPDWRRVITSTGASVPDTITFKDVKSLQSLKNFKEVEIYLEKVGENAVVESGNTKYHIPASCFSASCPFRFKLATAFLLPCLPKKAEVVLELFGKRTREYVLGGDGKERTERILIKRDGFQALINCIA